MAACRHCGRAKVARRLGLCWTCYHTPGVREQYPSTSKLARKFEDRERAPKEGRRPGEAHHRCLWCRAWRCDRPLAICDGCQGEYDAAAVGMGADDEEGSKPVPTKETFERAANVRRIIQSLGEGVTYEQARNHLAEDGIELTHQTFACQYQRVYGQSLRDRQRGRGDGDGHAEPRKGPVLPQEVIALARQCMAEIGPSVTHDQLAAAGVELTKAQFAYHYQAVHGASRRRVTGTVQAPDRPLADPEWVPAVPPANGHAPEPPPAAVPVPAPAPFAEAVRAVREACRAVGGRKRLRELLDLLDEMAAEG